MAARALTAARDSESIADVLHVFRDKLPDEHGPHITAIMAKLHAVSDLLTRLDQAGQHPQYSASLHRVQHDVTLVIESLQQTQQTVRDNVGRTRRMSFSRVWDDLNYHMDERESAGFHQRLLWYLGLLKADIEILQETPSSLDRELLAGEILNLLRTQISLNGRLPQTAGLSQLRPAESPISPVLSHDGIRPGYPIAPEAPLSPLSPTWTADSSMTLDSSHTSYSGLTSSPPPAHWARDVFDGAYPSTSFRKGYDTLEKSRCDGSKSSDAMYMLQKDGFSRALELQFDDETAWVRLYHRSSDGRARLLFLSNRTTFHCIPLTQLTAIRGRSELQLCRMRSNGNLELWALLNFASFERLALFYSTFVAMKRQDTGDTIDPRMFEDLNQLHETKHFHGRIRDGAMVHGLRLLEDKPSGVFRLEATPLRGSMANVPLWTAFITKYKRRGDEDWANLVRRGGSEVVLAALKPKPYVFLDGYSPPRRGHDWLLDFVEPEGGRLLSLTLCIR